MKTDDLMTTSQVARRLELSPERVRQMAREGAIPNQKVGERRLFRRRDVEREAVRRAKKSTTVAA